MPCAERSAHLSHVHCCSSLRARFGRRVVAICGMPTSRISVVRTVFLLTSLGEWNVTTPDGKPAGTSRIESIANGYGLLENWTGDPAAGGGNGKSLNCYNASSGKWQQFWVGSGGGVLELSGGFADGKMVLSGSHVVRGQKLIERISWTPNTDGTVRQFWEQSRDDGKTWQAIFDGLYRKK